MKKLILTSIVLGLATFAATEAYAGPCGGGRVVYTPAPATPSVTTGRVEGGYRSYSYQPAPTYRYYAPAMRGPSGGSGGFRDAGAKIRGEY